MKLDWPTFVVRPSVVISSLCYSIFRLEPYRSCPLSCAYCYARWYRSPHAAGGKYLVKQWQHLAEQLNKVGIPPPYFRLSTLAEPFQEAERKNRFSLDIMRAALRSRVPLVINTKSVLLGSSPWLDTLLKLADEGLALVQVSVMTLNEELAPRLEPHAPSPSARLQMAETLSEHGVPVVARVQPLIPGIEDEQVGAARSALEHGCRGVIVEPLRGTVEDLAAIAVTLGFRLSEYLSLYGWEPYPSKRDATGLLRPSLGWRRAMMEKLRREIGGKGVVTVCKDGLWPGFVSYSHDCCQAWLMPARYSLRRTVFEYVLKPQFPPPNVYLLDECEHDAFPRLVRKGLKLHYDKLKRVLESEALLTRVLGVARGDSDLSRARVDR